ncbi:MAG: hypothetical protein KGZ81_05115 [Flavobacteriales bacterium]|nr:hypothetical protein [Flavobacteriales bacterium]
MENRIKSVTSQYRQEKWANIIAERNASGLNVKDWCRINNIKESAYYYWLRKIRHSIIESFAQHNEKKDDITFVPMLSDSLIDNVESRKSDSLISTAKTEVIIRSGEVTVEFGNQTSQDLILKVLKVLKDV